MNTPALEIINQLQKELDWLYENCSIIYFPPGDNTYPIEHNPRANKNAKYLLKAQIPE